MKSLLMSVCLWLSAGLAMAEQTFLEPQQAFPVQLAQTAAGVVEVTLGVTPGHYLYRDKLKFSAPAGVQVGAPVWPAAQRKQDPYLGEQAVYHQPVRVRLPVSGDGRAFTLTVEAQGCAEAGLCYPPFAQQLPVPAAVALPQAAAPTLDESDRISRLLQGQSWGWVLLSFLGFGLMLAFTPCVFPMIPILSGMIVGQGHAISRWRAFRLSLVYVLGMALTYTAAGVAAGLSGQMLAGFLQNPWVLGVFALLFVVLALAMFDVYPLQLPASLQSRLSQRANGQGGSLLGIGVMGALSALIVGPCVAAPLAGALLYIGKTGDAWLGGAALFFMAIGMGLPLIAVGVATRAALPRAGGWMNAVKKVFGVLLLGVAFWLLAPVLPVALAMGLLALGLILAAVCLQALEPLPVPAGVGLRLRKAGGMVCLLAGGVFLVGSLGGAKSWQQPLAVFGASAQAATVKRDRFSPVANLAELEAKLAKAQRPVLLDFSADWCVACKEMEHQTFADPAVAARLNDFELLRADVTANTAEQRALLKRFGLFGPPGLVVLKPGSGEELGRVIGFVPAAAFLARLQGWQ